MNQIARERDSHICDSKKKILLDLFESQMWLYLVLTNCVLHHVARCTMYAPSAVQFLYDMFTLGGERTKKASCNWLSLFTSFFSKAFFR